MKANFTHHAQTPYVTAVENPNSGKILVGSDYGTVDHAIHVAVSCLNNSDYDDRDINFFCDHGATSIDFSAEARKGKSYSYEMVWQKIIAERNRWMKNDRVSPNL